MTVGHFDESGLEAAAGQLTADGIDVIRLTYSDLIGSERGRDLLVQHFPRTVGDGVAFCRSVYGTTPMGDVVDMEGGLSEGLPDIVAFPDLETFRPVPWEPGVASVIADLFNPDGSRSEESPRAVLRRVVDKFAELGMRPFVGPELEFYLLDQDEAAPGGWRRYGEATGNVYVSGLRGDPENTLLDALRMLGKYGLDVVAANHEFSSGQFEINLWHSDAMTAADRAFQFKSAIKELARRQGKRATFMAKPFNDEGGSGFHLHFSTWSDDGKPLFDDPEGEDGLSEIGRSAIAGVLAHAPALAALHNPTINSYKRFGPDTLAPYLAIASLLAGAYLGIRDGLKPPEKLVGYGYDTSKAEMLPSSLGEAIDALEKDSDLAEILGPKFVAAFVAYKRNELERFAHFVTDWEVREYAYHL